MSKIIGATVGTPMNPQKIIEHTKIEKEVRELSDKIDKLSIPTVNDILNALPTWQGGVY